VATNTDFFHLSITLFFKSALVIQKSKGIVLRSVKYGETSLVVTLFTELFGVQSYMVNGVRTSGKKSGSARASLFQPAGILELIAYQNQFSKLQRLKEYRWAYLFQQLFSDVPRNAVAMFMVELLSKCLKQPEPQPDLFYFMEDALHQLDTSSDKVMANFPLFFAIHLAVFFGFRISDQYTDETHYLDLEEGLFVNHQPAHPHYLQDREAAAVSQILKVMQPSELEQVNLNVESRRRITHALEQYYALHIPDFGTLRTLPVLREVLS
jgi:DNA repair protein RecO (recombination protein O)